MSLINREALADAMYDEAFEKDSEEQKWDGGCWIRYKMFERVVFDLPSVDAVEVIRCKDCRHFVRSEGVCKLLSNNYEPPVYVDDDDFCSRGERREARFISPKLAR